MKNFNKISVAFVVISILAGPLCTFAAGPASINLLSADHFAVLAKTGISTTGTTKITGDIGVSPAEASYVTGFGLTLSANNTFATSSIVNGKVYAPSYPDPTPANIRVAVSHMENAYTDGAGRTNPAATELGAGNIGGMTLAPGLYKWSTGVIIPTNVTLSGSANDVWIFQIAQNLDISSAVKINLSGGAQANNIFWIVAGKTTIGTTAVFNGTILDQTAIVLNTGAILNGRALAQSAVTLDASTVTIPSTVYTTTNNDDVVITHVQEQTITTTNNNSNSGSNINVTTNNTVSNASSFGQQVRAIVHSLNKGSHGADVVALQQFLISQNRGSAAVALGKVGATAYFGALTRAAVAEFQANVGIYPALGNFGPITRAYMQAHYY